jgi:hypothetical protein
MDLSAVLAHTKSDFSVENRAKSYWRMHFLTEEGIAVQ